MSVITKPVSIAAVASALGVSSHDLGTLCTSGQINKWCKYKPVRSAYLGETGVTSGHDWWKGNDGCCGLAIQYQKDDMEMLPFRGELTIDPEWEIVRPRGAQYGEWFRLLDSDGYETRQVAEGQTPVGYAEESDYAFEPYDTPVFNVNINANQSDIYILHSSDIAPKFENRDLGALTSWYVGLHAKPEGEQGVFLANFSGQERTLSYYQGVSVGRAQFYNPAGWGASSLRGKTWTFTPILYKYLSDGDYAVIGCGTAARNVRVFQYMQSVTSIFNSMTRSYSTEWRLNYNFVVENFTKNAVSVPVKILVSGSYDNRDLFEVRNTDEIELEMATLLSLQTKGYNSYLTDKYLSDSYPYIAANIQIYITTPWGTGWNSVIGDIWLKGEPPIQ